MPIRAEVGLEMVLNMGERSEERRLWRLGGMVDAFCCFCTGYEDLDKCSETTTKGRRRKKITKHTSLRLRGLLNKQKPRPSQTTTESAIRQVGLFHCANPASLALLDCASHK